MIEPFKCDWCTERTANTEDDHRILDSGDLVCDECFERAVDEVLHDFRELYGESPGPKEAYRTCADYVQQYYENGRDTTKREMKGA